MYKPTVTSGSLDQPSQPDINVKEHHSHQYLLSQEFFQMVLDATGTPLTIEASVRPRFSLPKLSRLQFAMVNLVAVLLIAGTYFIFLGARPNVDILKQPVINISSLSKNLSKATAAIDSSAPSTVPVTTAELAAYEVAPNLPKYLIIPKLNVDSRVESVGLTASGAIGTPDNIYDTAWYNGSSEPGQPGAMVIDGHVSSWTADGVFYNLKKLVPGDIIKVERGDGTIFSYQVVKSQIYQANSVNMQAAMTPIVSSQPGLNLITCTGEVEPGTSLFNERLIVFATQVSS